MSYELTGSQKTFVRELAAQTGLNTKTLQAWVLAEMGGKTSGAARKREAEGNYNWLNIAYFDAGPGSITKDKTWRSPKKAARATAQFLRGERFGPSSGIRKIIRTAGQDVDSQINAIANSGWASSGYEGGSVLRNLAGNVQSLHGVDAPKRSRAVVQTGAVLQPSNEDARAAALQSYVLNRGRPGALSALASGLEAAEQPVGGVSGASQTNPRQSGGEPRASSSFAQTAKQRADIIDAKKLPYLWGGGHGGKVDPKKATPLDCSGAVSSVLGINPRVSGDFRNWGSPGRAPGGKGVTIYANKGHILMEIDGHFWGTSKANPGGGAGWIPRSKISPEYLRGFTARHTKR